MLTQSKLNQLLIKVRTLKALYPNSIHENIYLDVTNFFHKLRSNCTIGDIPEVVEIDFDRPKRSLILEWYKIMEDKSFSYCSVEFLEGTKIIIRKDINEEGIVHSLSDSFEKALREELNKYRTPRKKKKYK